MAIESCKMNWKTKVLFENDIVRATGSSIDKDSEGQRKLKDSGGRLLLVVKEHSLE